MTKHDSWGDVIIRTGDQRSGIWSEENVRGDNPVRPYEFETLRPEDATPPVQTPPASRALTAEAIASIRRQHRITLPGSHGLPERGRPVYEFGYRPSDGRCCGSTLNVDVAEHRDGLVMITNEWLPSVEDLSRVRIAADGTVSWEVGE